MKYRCDVYRRSNNNKVNSFSDVADVACVDFDRFYVEIVESAILIKRINNKEDLNLWMEGLERASAWKPQATTASTKVALEIDTKGNVINHAIQKAVDPNHYKGYVDDYQWLDTMARLPTYRDKEKFYSALELQIRKYLDRNGQKDNPLQELKKARFYLQYWIEYLESGEIPSAAEIQKFFGGK